MTIIWLGILIEIIVLSIFNSVISDISGIAVVAVLIHITCSMIILMRYKDKLKWVLQGAFFMRILFMIWDLYASHIFILPNSGFDSESFYRKAIYFSKNISIIYTENGELYSKINGLLFYFIGPQRMFAQYINVLLGLSTVFIIFKILIILRVNEKTRITVTFIAAFFPNSIIFSAIFLREIAPTFFVSVSLYYFIRWFINSRYRYIILSFAMLGVASTFHSGVIGIIIGYIYVFLFYKRDSESFKFTVRTIVSFIAMGSLLFGGFILLGDEVLYKFGAVDELSDLYNVANKRYGGSAYLKGMTISSPIELVLYGPIKSFYFLTVPLPFNWRGFMDVLTFSSDSMLYLFTIIYYLKHRKHFENRQALVFGILVMIIGTSLIFGIGVSNAGTAVRHRQKLIPLFLVLLGVMMDGKRTFRVNETKKTK